ncbi:MAG: Maf family protein [Acholeplasmataceae bacterium]|nr:Maf family protein [Acholeplasmataceae bacterium]
MIILASQSPRRMKLLKDAGIEFKVIVNPIEETYDENLDPEEITMELAYQKAQGVSTLHPNDVVIGADTIVVFEGKILGKPKDEDEAKAMLTMLSGRYHEVYTGVAIIKGEKISTFYCEAAVKMKPLSQLQIQAYIDTKEPFDKAGAYAIQGQGGELVETYEGDFFTIMGLPLKMLLEKLKDFK